MHRRLARLECSGLHLDGDFGVPVGRIQADMPEPSPDHVDLHARLEQVDRRGVTEGVRGDDVAGAILPVEEAQNSVGSILMESRSSG